MGENMWYLPLWFCFVFGRSSHAFQAGLQQDDLERLIPWPPLPACLDYSLTWCWWEPRTFCMLGWHSINCSISPAQRDAIISSRFILLFLLCNHVHVHGSAHKNSPIGSQKHGITWHLSCGSPDLRSGTHTEFYAKAVCVLHHWFLSPTPWNSLLFFYF